MSARAITLPQALLFHPIKSLSVSLSTSQLFREGYQTGAGLLPGAHKIIHASTTCVQLKFCQQCSHVFRLSGRPNIDDLLILHAHQGECILGICKTFVSCLYLMCA